MVTKSKQEEFLDYLTDPTKVIVRKKRDKFLNAAKTINYTEDKPKIHLEEHNTYYIIHAKSFSFSSLNTLDTLFDHIFKDYQIYTRIFGSTLTAPGYTSQPTIYVHKYYICTNVLGETELPKRP